MVCKGYVLSLPVSEEVCDTSSLTPLLPVEPLRSPVCREIGSWEELILHDMRDGGR